MPKAASTPTTPEKRPLPLELIDLDAHPDGELMRMCATAINILDTGDLARAAGPRAFLRWVQEDARVLEVLRQSIVHRKASTREGLSMKAHFALAVDGGRGDMGLAAAQPSVSVVRDMMRLGFTP